MGMLPSQTSDSQEGPGICSRDSSRTGQALFHQMCLDPAKHWRKLSPAFSTRPGTARPTCDKTKGRKTLNDLVKKEPDSPLQLLIVLMAATESMGERGQRK